MGTEFNFLIENKKPNDVAESPSISSLDFECRHTEEIKKLPVFLYKTLEDVGKVNDTVIYFKDKIIKNIRKTNNP